MAGMKAESKDLDCVGDGDLRGVKLEGGKGISEFSLRKLQCII